MMSESTSETIDDGGSAFPVPYPGGQIWAPGMTLRDYFAGQALAGLVAANEDIANDGSIESSSDVADRAYIYADAMLNTRESN